ncbi:MAG: Bug family tripartite tricarboxylate transporter substrate binding protein [Pigmentiphaga sp.]
MKRRRFASLLLAAAVSCLAAPLALAQQTNTIIIGFAAGGSVDATARLLAEQLTKITGDTYIVENRTGAAGRIAINAVKRAAPDGKTLVLVPQGPMTLFPNTFASLDYEPRTDFTPIGRLVTQENVLVLANDVPATNGAELKAWLQQNPGLASFGSPGTGTVPHFVGEAVAHRLGVPMTNVPYKGSALTANDVASGVLKLGFMPAADALPLVRQGRMKILATTGAERSPLTPDYPTMREVGIDYSLDGWYALFGPAGMDPKLVESLNANVVKAMSEPSVVERLGTLALVAAPGSPTELTELVERERAEWAELVRETGFKPL